MVQFSPFHNFHNSFFFFIFQNLPILTGLKIITSLFFFFLISSAFPEKTFSHHSSDPHLQLRGDVSSPRQSKGYRSEDRAC